MARAIETLDERSRGKVEEARSRARPGTKTTSSSSSERLAYTIKSVLFAELKGELGWTRLGYARTFPIAYELVPDNCPRINYLEVRTYGTVSGIAPRPHINPQVDEKRFIGLYEAPGLPVIITHSQLDWQANQKWTIEASMGKVVVSLSPT